MNHVRRQITVATALLAFADLAPAGLAQLMDKAMGSTGQVHIILVDDTPSITDSDRVLYRDTALLAIKQAKPGDRIVIARISSAKLGAFRTELDRQVPNTGRHYDDLAAGEKVRAEARTSIESLLVPAKKGTETRILDVLSALAPLVAEAAAAKQRLQLLMLTDAIEESGGADMAKSTVDAKWIERVIAARQRDHLVPNLQGTEVFVVGAGGRSAADVKAIEAFWTRYLKLTGAQLKFYGRTVPRLDVR